MKTERERRFTPAAASNVEMRIDDEKKNARIAGYGAVFYRADKPGTEYALGEDMFERIMPGAFDNAISADDARGLINHDANLILGRTGSKTMRLAADETGLRYEIDLPNTSYARDLQESLSRGDITGSSFSFQVTGRTWREEMRADKKVFIREITGVKLFDVGPVTFPAYSATTSELRADGEAELNAAKLKAEAEAKAAADKAKADAKAAADIAAARARAVEVDAKS